MSLLISFRKKVRARSEHGQLYIVKHSANTNDRYHSEPVAYVEAVTVQVH